MLRPHGITSRRRSALKSPAFFVFVFDFFFYQALQTGLYTIFTNFLTATIVLAIILSEIPVVLNQSTAKRDIAPDGSDVPDMVQLCQI